MRKILLTLAGVLWCGLAVVRADDVAEVRRAFDLFVQYQKTDDKRMLDQYARDVSITITYDTGREKRDMTLPADTFRELVSQDIEAKRGNQAAYEEVTYTQDGDTVKVAGTVVFDESGKRGPFVAVYGKDASGSFKVTALKLTVPVDKLPPGS